MPCCLADQRKSKLSLMTQENLTGSRNSDDKSGDTEAISLSILELHSLGALLPDVGSPVQRDLYD